MGTAGVSEEPDECSPHSDPTGHRAGSHYINSARRSVGDLSSLRATASSFIPTAGVRKPIYGPGI